MTVPTLPLPQRLWLAWVCFFRILFDGVFAARAASLRDGAAAPAFAEGTSLKAASLAPPAVAETTDAAARAGGALQLLGMLQREGRLLDFLQQDIAAFPDSEIGAAARVVHEGCRRVLHGHARVTSVRSEPEGAALTLERATEEVKLVGNVAGHAPYRGVLRHRGWRVDDLTLPTRVGAHDAKLVAPAELELS